MIVHHSRRLHEGVADGAADKFESPFFHFLTHGVAFGGGGWDLGKFFPLIMDGFTTDKGPTILAEGTEFFPNLQVDAGVKPYGIDLEPVADNARIFQNSFQLLIGQAGQFFRIESLKNFCGSFLAG